MSRSDLDDVRRDLYAGPRATFLERRKAAAADARRGGDREQADVIAALRKPSAAAHLVNLLAQAHDDALNELVDLGAEIRDAFERGDDGEMRELLRRRPAAIAEAVAHARAMARSGGDTMSAAVTDQITQTLRAAMASATAGEEARSGTLTDALDDPGFASLGVAPPARQQPPKPVARRGKKTASTGAPDRTEAEAQAAAAEEARRVAEISAALRDAEAAAAEMLRTAERELAASAAHRAQLEEQREGLVARLAEVDEELAAARIAEEDAQRAHGDASSALDDARAALDS